MKRVSYTLLSRPPPTPRQVRVAAVKRRIATRLRAVALRLDPNYPPPDTVTVYGVSREEARTWEPNL